MPDCWFVVCRVGKREIRRLGCKCAIKDTRVQKNVVWVLYRKIAFVCTGPSHLCRWLYVQLNRERETVESEIGQEASCVFTSCDLLKVSRQHSVREKRTESHFTHFFSFSYHQDCAGVFFSLSSPVEEAENVAQVCSFTSSVY